MTDIATLIPDRSNWIGAYVDWADQRLMAPTAFKLGAALACVSAAIGKGVWVRLGHRKWTPHLWMMFVGPAGASKSTPVAAVEDFVRRARGDDAILAGRWSIEGLYKPLEQVPDPFWDIGELSGLLGHLRKEYMSGGRSELTDLWDGKPFKRVTASQGTQGPDRTAITGVCGARPDDFTDAAGLADFSSGMLSRFLMLEASDAGPYVGLDLEEDRTDAATEANEKALRLTLAEIGAWRTPDVPHDVKIAREAVELWNHADRAWREEAPGLDRVLSGWGQRRGIQTLKLAVLHGLGRLRRPVVEAEDIYWGLSLVEAHWNFANRLSLEEVGLDRDAPRRIRIKHVAQQIARSNGETPPGIVGFRELNRKVQRMIRDARELRGIIQTWIDSGEYEWGEIPTGGPARRALLAEGYDPPPGWRTEP